MSEENAFLRAIRTAPGDATPRLVYADWLEERGDVRGEYLRLVLVGDAQNPAVRERLKQLQSQLDPLWLALMHHGFSELRREPRPARRRRRRKLQEADISLFLKQYARKKPGGMSEPNDRHYSREVEARVKRMKPEQLDRLMRGEAEEG